MFGTPAGSLFFDTKLDTKGFQRGLNQITDGARKGGSTIKNIVAGLGITKLIASSLNVIKNSVGDAVKRFDTLNNFPKVMENMGISAKAADKEMKRLSDGITGLPTTLDAAALAVQKFTAANGNVQRSTDIFLALNDAIVAGGASTEIQASALEQMSQAYAKGKPDMVEWRTLQTAMPGQLRQVAQAMGYAGGNVAMLGKDLREGNVSMDKFMDAIVKLDKNGANGFKSFKDQAQDAVGGIGTSITNARTAIVRGVTQMIESLNKGMKRAGMGTIAENIAKLGKRAETAFKNLGRTLEKVPFDKLFKAIKRLIPAIGTLITGMIAYNVAMKGLRLASYISDFVKITKVVLGLSKTAKLTAGSMKLLQAAMAMNPIGLAIAGVTALAAGLYLLSKRADENKTATDRNAESLQKYKQSMAEVEKEKDAALSKSMGEISYYENLKTELLSLVDANGRVKAGYEDRAKFIASTLNEALGTEISITNGVIKNYETLEEKVGKLIEAKRAEYLIEANEAKYNAARDKRAELEKKYANQLATVNKLESQRKGKIDEIAKAINVSSDELQQFIDKNGNLDTFGLEEYIDKMYMLDRSIDPQKAYNAMNAYRELNGEYGKAIPVLQNYKKEVADNAETIYKWETATQKAADKNYEAAVKVYEDEVNIGTKRKEMKAKDYQDEINAQIAHIQYLNENKDKYDADFIAKETKKSEAVIQNLSNEQAKYKQKTQDTQQHIKGIWNQGMRDLLQDLTGHDVKFVRIGKNQVQMYVDGQKQGKPMSDAQAKKVADGVVDELNKAKKGGKTAGTDVIKGVEDGIDYQKGSAFTKIANFGASLLGKLKASLKEKSPSRATREMGIDAIKGLELGVDKERPKALKQIDKFGKEVLQKMSDAVSFETGKMNMDANLKSSIFNNNTIVLNAQFDGQVDIDGKRAGRLLAPEITRTIKTAGGEQK